MCRCVCSASEQQRVISRCAGAETGQRGPSPAASCVVQALVLSLPGLPAAANVPLNACGCASYTHLSLSRCTAIPFQRPGRPARADTRLVAPSLPVEIIVASCPPRSLHVPLACTSYSSVAGAFSMPVNHYFSHTGGYDGRFGGGLEILCGLAVRIDCVLDRRRASRPPDPAPLSLAYTRMSPPCLLAGCGPKTYHSTQLTSQLNSSFLLFPPPSSLRCRRRLVADRRRRRRDSAWAATSSRFVVLRFMLCFALFCACVVSEI